MGRRRRVEASGRLPPLQERIPPPRKSQTREETGGLGFVGNEPERVASSSPLLRGVIGKGGGQNRPKPGAPSLRRHPWEREVPKWWEVKMNRGKVRP